MSIREFRHAGQSRRKVPSPKLTFPAWRVWLGRQANSCLTVAKQFAEGYLDTNLAEDRWKKEAKPFQPFHMSQVDIKQSLRWGCLFFVVENEMLNEESVGVYHEEDDF